MTSICPRCRRPNPRDALFCYFDGNLLNDQGRTTPAQGLASFLTPLVFPSGRTCQTCAELALACLEHWDEARGLLRDGHFQQFLANIGRHDLAQAALREARFPDADRGLDQFLNSLPGTTLPAPQLTVQPQELHLGVMRPGQNGQFTLRLGSGGNRLLYGSAACPDAPWLTLGKPDGGKEILFKFSGEHALPLFVRGEQLRAAKQPLVANLVIDSNGGSVTVPVRVDVPVKPFPAGPLAGAVSPRQLAEKAKLHPKEAAAEFEQGAVAAWYRDNGWAYPVRGVTSLGVAAVQQFFEALGLTAPPRLTVKPPHLDVLASPGKTVQARLLVVTEEKRPVYAHGHSNQPWLRVGQPVLKGRSAEIPLTIEAPSERGRELTAEVTVTGNGNQQFRVPVKLITPAVAGGTSLPAAVESAPVLECLPEAENVAPAPKIIPASSVEAETPAGHGSLGLVGIGMLLLLLLGVGLASWLVFASHKSDNSSVAQNQSETGPEERKGADAPPSQPENTTGDKTGKRREQDAGSGAGIGGKKEAHGGGSRTDPGGPKEPMPTPPESAHIDTLNFKKLDYFKNDPKRELPPALPDFVKTASWKGHTNHVRGVAFGYEDKYVVSVSGDVGFVKDADTGKRRQPDFSIRVWDPKSGAQLHKVDGFKEPLDGVSVSPGGRFAAFGFSGAYGEDGVWKDSTDHRVRLWDIESKKEIPAGITLTEYLNGKRSLEGEPRFAGLDSSVFSTHFSPDGSMLVGAANNGRVIVWDTEKKAENTIIARKVLCFPSLGGAQGVTQVRFSPDGTRLLTCNGDFTLSVWDVHTPRELTRLRSHRDTVWTVAAYHTKEGKLLALSGSGRWQGKGGFYQSLHKDYAIRLWDLTDPTRAKLLQRFQGHTDSVQTVAFCPNGRHFVSGSMDGTVRLWDWKSGKELRRLGEHKLGGKLYLVRSVSVSHDGRSVVSGGDDNMVRFWRLPATARDLLAAIKANRLEALRAAVNDIDTMGSEDCREFPQLFAALEGVKDADMRKLVVRALSALATRASKTSVAELFKQLPVKGLIELLRSGEAEEQYLAVCALCSLGKEAREAIKPLCAFLRNAPPEQTALKGIEALQQIGEKRAEIVTALEGAMQHPEEAVRLAAARVIAGFGADFVKVVPFLELLTRRDSSAEAQEVAEKALREAHLTREDVPKLREGLRSTRERAIIWSTDAVASLGEQAKEVLPDLRSLLKHKDAKVRSHCLRALRALGKQAAAAAAEVVTIILEGTENESIAEAVLTLHALDPANKAISKGIPSLVDSLKPTTGKEAREALANPLARPAVKLLIGLGEPVVEALFKALSSWDPGETQFGNRRKKPENLARYPTIARCQAYRVIRELAEKATPGSALAKSLTADDKMTALYRTYWARENALKSAYRAEFYQKTYQEATEAWKAVKKLKEK